MPVDDAGGDVAADDHATQDVGRRRDVREGFEDDALGDATGVLGEPLCGLVPGLNECPIRLRRIVSRWNCINHYDCTCIVAWMRLMAARGDDGSAAIVRPRYRLASPSSRARR